MSKFPQELEQNRVVMGGEGSGKRKEFDLSANGNDVLWKKQRGSAFPLVAEAIQSEVEEYKGKEEEIKRLKQHIVSFSLLVLPVRDRVGNAVC